MTSQASEPTIKVGHRNYKQNLTWSRRDKIFLGDRCIGVINLKSNDRAGQTTSLVSQASIAGRQISWCVDQSTMAERPRTPVTTEAFSANANNSLARIAKIPEQDLSTTGAYVKAA
jgi:Tfp pilus assembly protein PilV